jgi:hypothetical protein
MHGGSRGEGDNVGDETRRKEKSLRRKGNLGRARRGRDRLGENVRVGVGDGSSRGGVRDKHEGNGRRVGRDGVELDDLCRERRKGTNERIRVRDSGR